MLSTVISYALVEIPSAIHNQLGENVGISVEPCRRDTFPAIALAAAYLKDVQGVGEEESVVVCPVDPYVEDDYFEALKALGERAQKSDSNLVLMGIEPTYPSEKYGYIIPLGKEAVSRVSMFKEKPTQEVAKETVVDGMEQSVRVGDVITMAAGCRHTVIAETELKLIEVQLGEDINVHDKQKFELEY